MIVVFIIGLIATMISLSMGEDKSKAAPRLEARALVQAISFAGEYAALNGDVVAMFITLRDSGEGVGRYWCYDWKRYLDNAWIKLPEDSLSEHCMDERVQWELVVEGHDYTYDPDLEIQPPVLVFSSSGEATPVEMAIFEQASGSEAQHIEIDMMGNSRWREEEVQKNEDSVNDK